MLDKGMGWSVWLVVVLLGSCQVVSAAGNGADADELRALKQEVEVLKEGQRALARDVAELRRMLRSVQPARKGRQPVQDVDLSMDVANDPFQGEADAPLVLVEMTDFQCPYCRRHLRKVVPHILERYVAAGRLKYVVRDFPLPAHRDAGRAAEAAHCAGSQGRYWEMHELLFEHQRALGADRLAAYAVQLGLETDAFTVCVDSGTFTAKVHASVREGRKAGVRGTPTSFIGRVEPDGTVRLTKRIRGAQPFSVFQETIDAMLGDGGAAAPADVRSPEKAGDGSG